MDNFFRRAMVIFVLVLFNVIYPFSIIYDAFKDEYVDGVKDIWNDAVEAWRYE